MLSEQPLESKFYLQPYIQHERLQTYSKRLKSTPPPVLPVLPLEVLIRKKSPYNKKYLLPLIHLSYLLMLRYFFACENDSSYCCNGLKRQNRQTGGGVLLNRCYTGTIFTFRKKSGVQLLQALAEACNHLSLLVTQRDFLAPHAKHETH